MLHYSINCKHKQFAVRIIWKFQLRYYKFSECACLNKNSSNPVSWSVTAFTHSKYNVKETMCHPDGIFYIAD